MSNPPTNNAGQPYTISFCTCGHTPCTCLATTYPIQVPTTISNPGVWVTTGQTTNTWPTWYPYSTEVPTVVKKFAKVTVLPGGTAPTPGTTKSVGYDLSIAEDASIGARGVKLVGCGLIITPPEDAWIMIAARSSLHKRGLVLANSVGIVDPDYCGPTDEIKLALMNVTDETVYVKQGDRLAQLIFMPRYEMYTWERVSLEERAADRGGFGSTGQ